MKVWPSVTLFKMGLNGCDDRLLDVLAYPNEERYPRQRVLVVAQDNYAYLVPFVEERDYFFLKTVIPSRKATRDYLNTGENDAHST